MQDVLDEFPRGYYVNVMDRLHPRPLSPPHQPRVAQWEGRIDQASGPIVSLP